MQISDFIDVVNIKWCVISTSFKRICSKIQGEL